MIEGIHIKNFRSIEEATVDLAPLVLLYGPTASGKSSLLYALLVLRNFLINPNRPPDAFFHLGFVDLGGFEECVFNHDVGRSVELAVYHQVQNRPASYCVSLSPNQARLEQQCGSITMRATVPIPYSMNKTFSFSCVEDGSEYTINWNGVACSVSPKTSTNTAQDTAARVAAMLNATPEAIKAVDVAPSRRGFSKPSYTAVPVSPLPTSEDEVASLVIGDRNLPPRIAMYAERIVGRDFRVYIAPGTATAFFQTADKASRTPSLLVNDGFGVNQVVYLLAKILRRDVRTILIEEQEVHLHPTAERGLVRELCTIIRLEKKQIIITTHSELFVTSILSAVGEGRISPKELKCYLCTKDRRRTQFVGQEIQANGQIEGGLESFIEGELEDLRAMLGIKE